jgi:hypothetical protein
MSSGLRWLNPLRVTRTLVVKVPSPLTVTFERDRLALPLLGMLIAALLPGNTGLDASALIVEVDVPIGSVPLVDPACINGVEFLPGRVDRTSLGG